MPKNYIVKITVVKNGHYEDLIVMNFDNSVKAKEYYEALKNGVITDLSKKQTISYAIEFINNKTIEHHSHTR